MHTCRQPAFIQGSPVLQNRSLEIQTCIVDLINPSVFLFSSFQIELTILLLHLTAHPLTVRRLASRWVGWCSGSGGSTARRSSASSLAHHPPIPPSLPIAHNLTVLSYLFILDGWFLPPTFFYVGAVICLPATPHTAVPTTSVWLPAAGHPGLLPRWQLCLHTFPIE